MDATITASSVDANGVVTCDCCPLYTATLTVVFSGLSTCAGASCELNGSYVLTPDIGSGVAGSFWTGTGGSWSCPDPYAWTNPPGTPDPGFSGNFSIQAQCYNGVWSLWAVGVGSDGPNDANAFYGTGSGTLVNQVDGTWCFDYGTGYGGSATITVNP
jgi:hypothetical protein